MIVPMKKVSLIILGDKKKDTLKKLRKLGLVHIEISEGNSPRIGELNGDIALLERAIYTASERLDKNAPQTEADRKTALEKAERIEALVEELSDLRGERIALDTEIERLKEWGEIDPAELEALVAKGVKISLYDMPAAEFDSLGEMSAVALSRDKYSVKAMVMHSENEDRETLDRLEKYRFKLPEKPTLELRADLERLTEKIKSAEEELKALASYSDSMKAAIKEIEKDIRFEVYESGMNEENLSTIEGGSFSVSHFTGFIQAENLEKLQQVAKENSWGLAASDPTEEDNAPTELRNNRFVSLIYPLTDFLGTVPGYFEYDISAWFLGFILIFFGIIFGDGGYGLLITAISAVPIIKSLISKKPIQPAFLLFGLFGLSTILWGILTCTWFGLSADVLPLWLQKLSVPVLSNVYADKIWYPFWTNGTAGLTTSQNIQIFCFALALVQLSVAHIKGAIRNKGSLKILGDIGSILQLFGIFYLVLSLVVNGAVFGFGLVISGIPIGTIAIVLIAVGFTMSFVFSNYEGKIGASILASLKDIVSVLLGVINVFSDIVSYIRLWAVGLAGAAISATVNDLVSPFLGNFLFIIVVLVLLIFGHGLNMILNVLSVIVHGIRLNTLEFSSHLGMSWSGHKYDPFKE